MENQKCKAQECKFQLLFLYKYINVSKRSVTTVCTNLVMAMLLTQIILYLKGVFYLLPHCKTLWVHTSL